jgi:hypothetical protein
MSDGAGFHRSVGPPSPTSLGATPLRPQRGEKSHLGRALSSNSKLGQPGETHEIFSIDPLARRGLFQCTEELEFPFAQEGAFAPHERAVNSEGMSKTEKEWTPWVSRSRF